jgi:3-oxoacyl-[acyl-carrier protein] reductase
VTTMADAIKESFGRLDILVLNASGGLEKDKPANYAMKLNLTAQVRTLEAVLPLMAAGGCVIFVTSHLAHFYGRKPVYAAYEGIAASKKAGEDALRSKMPEFEARDLRLAIVSGDMIDGTITPKLLERTQRGLIESRRGEAGALPTVQEFASAIVDAAADSGRPNGRNLDQHPGNIACAYRSMGSMPQDRRADLRAMTHTNIRESRESLHGLR